MIGMALDGAPETMDAKELSNILQAVLLVADKPMGLENMQQLFEPGGEPDRNTLRQALSLLEQSLDGRPLELVKVASGWRLQVGAAYAPWIARLWTERAPRYSRAFMETLALVVYRQPITRAEIEEIRGVGLSSSIVKTMLEREWIRVVGHQEVPGRPELFGTSKQFLDDFGLESLAQLPALPDIRDEADVAESMRRLAESGAVMKEGADANE